MKYGALIANIYSSRRYFASFPQDNIQIGAVMNLSLTKLAANIFPFIFVLLASAPAMAGQPPIGNIPEPDILSLFALGGAVMVGIAIRKRRNKK